MRTFEAKELIGVEESLAMMDELWPFNAVFGFSQGAMLASVVCARGIGGDPSVLPEAAVITGAAYPMARGAELEAMREAPPKGLRSLHVIGDADRMNPPEQGRKVAGCFDGDGDSGNVLSHPGGHVVPLDDDAIKAYVDIMNGVKVTSD